MAIINTIKRKGFIWYIGLKYISSLMEVRAAIQSWGPWRQTEVDYIIMPLTGLLTIVCLIFYTTWDHLSRCDIIHTKLGTPTPVTNENLALQLFFRAVWWRQLFSWHFLFSDDSSFCQVNNKKQNKQGAKPNQHSCWNVLPRRRLTVNNYWLK